MTETYVSLIAGGVATRHAAVLTGLVRSTETRRRRAAAAPTPAVSAPPACDPALVEQLGIDLQRREIDEPVAVQDLQHPAAFQRGQLVDRLARYRYTKNLAT
jgi:hypothetical protein